LKDHKHKSPVPIILASGSPRRKELLRQMHLPFKAIESAIAEDYATLNGLPAAEQVLELARRKVQAVAARLPAKRCYWIAGFDTLVELEGKILGKPVNRQEAARMLAALSGQSHHVHTGVALLAAPGTELRNAVCTTMIKFKPMSPRELDFYLATNEWQGVAGAYRIQERGAFFIETIAGDYSNVVGLPISLFYGMLRDCEYPFTL
jgi:septum formation protein